MIEEMALRQDLLRATLIEEEKVLDDLLRWYDNWDIDNEWVRIYIIQARNSIARAKKELPS